MGSAKQQRAECIGGSSIFQGGFSREAASVVADCSLKILRDLCDHSMVKLRSGGGYTLHPLTRQFAGSNQNSPEDLRRKYCCYYSSFLQDLEEMMQDHRQADALAMMVLEFPNIREGLFFSCETHNRKRMIAYSRAISTMLQMKSRFSEGIELYSKLLGMIEENADESLDPGQSRMRTIAELKERIGNFLLMSGRTKDAEPYLRSAAELTSLFGDFALDTLCLGSLGNIAYIQRDLVSAEKEWSQALTAARKARIPRSESSLLCNLATVCRRRGNMTEAREFLEEAAKIISDSGDIHQNAVVLSSIADLMEIEGDLPGAEERNRESLALSLEVGDPRVASNCLDKLSRIVCERSPAEALGLARESFRLAGESGVMS